MKKIILAFILIIFITPFTIYADEENIPLETIEFMETDFIPFSYISSHKGCEECGITLQNKYIFNNFNEFYSNPQNKDIFNTLWSKIDFKFDDYTSLVYYSVLILSDSSKQLELNSIFITLYYYDGTGSHSYSALYFDGEFYADATININGSSITPTQFMPHYNNASPFVVGTGDYASTWFYLPTTSFMNLKKYYNQSKSTEFKLYNSKSELIKTVGYGDRLPTLYEWGDFDPEAAYKTVNLNDYVYVILSLKDYSIKDPFETNLKVKGKVGITPLYEFGTVEKETITDRCSVNYNEYTDLRLYILENDLINNAIYLVKGCQSNSSFKFDSTIFDITYVTADNVDDPVITVGGQEYHTIPFDKLTNSANQNEENNFIPGESTGFNPIGSITSSVSSFWNTLTTFMSLITKFFNTLPLEIRSVCITTFTIACTLGLLKILKS